MIIAIMQPYLFPYIGYFQLISHANKFILYDDVAFIKQGWINRNKILTNTKEFYFTVPLQDISSYRTIKDHWLSTTHYPLWKNKFLKTLQQNYSRSPYYKCVYPIIENILAIGLPNTISSLNYSGLKAVCDYLEIATPIVKSSVIYKNSYLKSQERVIDICRQEGTEIYLNMIGGADLYDYIQFQRHGIKLMFLKPELDAYNQSSADFIPGLSIIDLLMNIDKEETQKILRKGKLIEGLNLKKVFQ